MTPMTPKTATWIGWVFLVSFLLIVSWVTEWMLLLEVGFLTVGYFVGDFLMRGAHRLFGWGESTLWSSGWGVGVGVAIIYLILRLVLEPQSLAAIALVGIFGVIVGFATRAGAISRQLRTEDRRP
jgi:hypothetical protein